MIETIGSSDRGKIVRLDLRRADEPGHQHKRNYPLARIHVLGSMRATYQGSDILPRGRKARALLGYLSLTSGTRIPRSRMAAMLWDRSPDAQARTSFRQALRELSLAMGAACQRPDLDGPRSWSSSTPICAG